MVVQLPASELHRRLAANEEVAVLDAREQGAFLADHLFWGSCVPLSRLELELAALVPRRDAPVVWVDADGASGGLAARAAARSEALGWSDVAVLDGGVAGWPGERYSGVNVPSKAFGEWVEREDGTPHVTPAELARWQTDGANVVIVDSRPLREFRRMSIPGGIDCPGAELVYRVPSLVPDPSTTVVVNCAGRTRSIIGAQSLRNAGLPNPVFALEGGTMGWELAGLTVASGVETMAPLPSGDGLARAVASAKQVASRFGIAEVDGAVVDAWQADSGRTTYVFDVRSPEEYEAGHLASARHAPGGQLVQATDEYIGVLGARVVLIDDGSLVRATMTASWLAQLGRYEVVVARLDGETVPGQERAQLLGGPYTPAQVSVAELAALGEAVTVLDLADSLRYRRGHLPGAWWAVRSRFDAVDLPADANVVLTCPDGRLSAVAWADAVARWPQARVLDGGSAAWVGAGHPLDTSPGRLTTTTDDVWYKPYDAADAAVQRQHMIDYLTWEVALLEQIARDDLVAFRRF